MIDQLAIAVLGVSAVWLSQDKRPERARWACVCGLAAQPFWFYTTLNAGQYVITGLCLFYGAGWFRGFMHYWVRA